MILVFILLGTLILVSMTLYFLFLSSIQIEIKQLHILKSPTRSKVVFTSKVGVYVLGKVPIAKFSVTEKTIKKIYESGKINFKKLKKNKNINTETAKEVMQLPINIEQFNLQGYLGTESAALTPMLTTLMNALISIALAKKIKNIQSTNYTYAIEPVYINQNLVNLELNCIISIKIVHIINMLFNIKKESVKKDERTSNRRSYAYSHE